MVTAWVWIAGLGCAGLDPEGPGWQIGAEGTPPVESELVWEPRVDFEVPDIAFDPMHDNRVWVMMRPRAGAGELLCEPNNQSGCDAMPSRTATIDAPGTDDQRARIIEDSNAWHFMRRTVAMAMGEGTGFWGSCGDFWTGNTTEQAFEFIGPSLWSSDLTLHGVTPPNLNGSHFDMLHGTPWCTGIAWETDNVYWVYNGALGAIERVNFNADHGPGEADHSDGEYQRYAEGEFATIDTRVRDVPTHMHIDGDWLYIADANDDRIMRLDITSGRPGQMSSTLDPVPVMNMRNVTLEEFATMDMPSGMVVHDGIVYASGFESATITAFDMEGFEVGTIDLSDTVDTVTGLDISPEGWLYYTDMDGGAVHRLVPVLDE